MNVRAIVQRRPASWLIGVAGPLAIGLLLVLWQVVQATGACPLPERQATGADGSAVLDAAHPWVEQRVVVDLDATVMSSEFQPTVTLSVLPSTAPPSEDIDRHESQFQILFLDDETSEVQPRIGNPENADLSYGSLSMPTIDLHCALDAPCHRTMRVVLRLPDPRPGQSVAVSWHVGLKVSYPKALVPCVPPYAGTMTVMPDRPVTRPAADLTSAALPVESVLGELTAHHLIIRTSGVDATADGPSTTALRIEVFPSEPPGYGWQGWVRVLADGSGTPSVDGSLGKRFAGLPENIDVPVMTDCDPVAACERGYWLVLQSFSSVPPWDQDPFGDPAVDPFAWSAEVLRLGDGAGTTRLAVERDHPGPGLGATTTLEIPNQKFTMPASNAAWAIDTTFTLPRPATVDGLDPAAAAMDLIPLKINGGDVTATVAGTGATDVTARFNGDQTGYLLAHPFDGCRTVAVGAPCSTTVRFVIDIAQQAQYGSQHTGAEVDWAMRLHGVPPGTTYQIADPVELPRPVRFEAGPPIIAAVLALLSGAVAIVVTGRRRRRRAGPGD